LPAGSRSTFNSKTARKGLPAWPLLRLELVLSLLSNARRGPSRDVRDD
jgi:hypothetical protein